jgi:hypothetical protein
MLQPGCAVLDGKLDALFRERYPKFRLIYRPRWNVPVYDCAPQS